MGIRSKLKKRHRKDLTADEIEAIVIATRQPFCLLKDVALRFRLPVSLVGRLVREAEKKPETQMALRERTKLTNQKKVAIESSVNRLLKSNKPIVRIQQVQEAVHD